MDQMTIEGNWFKSFLENVVISEPDECEADEPCLELETDDSINKGD